MSNTRSCSIQNLSSYLVSQPQAVHAHTEQVHSSVVQHSQPGAHSPQGQSAASAVVTAPQLAFAEQLFSELQHAATGDAWSLQQSSVHGQSSHVQASPAQQPQSATHTPHGQLSGATLPVDIWLVPNPTVAANARPAAIFKTILDMMIS
ncbi:MAG: hypothetical protein R3C09_00670 [Pirellulaceae bacterium]|jgi:hypothetical protein